MCLLGEVSVCWLLLLDVLGVALMMFDDGARIRRLLFGIVAMLPLWGKKFILPSVSYVYLVLAVI